MIDIKYIIYSYIIGDSFGLSKLCNDKLDTISLEYNDVLNIEKGYFSSMTSFMLATMDSINKSKSLDPIDVLNKMCTSLIVGKYTNNGKIYALDKETINILEYYRKKNNLNYEYKLEDISSYSLSRLIPITLYDYSRKENNINKLMQIIGLTTSNEIVLLGNFILYSYIINLLNGLDKYKSLKISIPNMFKNKSINIYKDILKGNIYYKDIKYDDNIVNVIKIIFYIILNSDNYTDILNMVNSLTGYTNIYSSIIFFIASIIYNEDERILKMKKDLKNKRELNMYINNFEKVIK